MQGPPVGHPEAGVPLMPAVCGQNGCKCVHVGVGRGQQVRPPVRLHRKPRLICLRTAVDQGVDTEFRHNMAQTKAAHI